MDDYHFVVVYSDHGNYSYGTSIIGTLSVNNLTFGFEYVFNSSYTEECSVTTLDATHFVAAYNAFDTYANLMYGKQIMGIAAGHMGNAISWNYSVIFNTAIDVRRWVDTCKFSF